MTSATGRNNPLDDAMAILRPCAKPPCSNILGLTACVTARGGFAPGRRPAWPRRAGLSLIEILVTVTLLAAGAVWVLQAFARSWEASTVAQQRGTAYLLALTKMSEIELRLREEAPVEALTREGDLRQPPQIYHWSWQATPTADKPPTFAVELAITWKQGRLPYEERLSTILTNPPPETPS